MDGQLFIGITWTCFTIGVATAFIGSMAGAAQWCAARMGRWPHWLRDNLLIMVCVIWLLMGVIAVAACWAWLFLRADALSDATTAFYFALVCITTVGFGDIILPEETRLLAAFSSAGGFVVFGLYTAAIFEVYRSLRGTATADG
jgi:hypothetical protein